MKNNIDVKTEFLKFKSWLLEHRDNYQARLAEKPYCIDVKCDTVFGRDLALFKYNQIESDFSQSFVKLCRGLILDAHSFEPISFPFVKFHNFGEQFADEIDWSSCQVQEKIDGSICKVVKLRDNLLWSTNGVPNAFNATLTEQIGCAAKSFGDLMLIGLKNAFDVYLKKAMDNCWCIDKWFDSPEEWFKSLLQEGYTYIFELTSPFSKVVVQHHDTKLNFLGCRNNNTFQEISFNEHPLKDCFNTPKVFPLTSLDECKAAAEAMGSDQEGFVVCDKTFSRIKVKSPLYVSLSHMKNNGVLSIEHCIEIIRSNELDEVLAYFPEFKSHFDQIKNKIEQLKSSLEASWDNFNKECFASRKEAAIWINKNFVVSGCGFALLDGKVKSAGEWLDKCLAKNLVKHLGLKNED